MSTARMYYQNFLTQGTFGGFSVAGSAVAMAVSGWSPYYDFSAGGALFETRGTYTGAFEADYVVEIHICPDGTLPTSRWRWSDDGGATWDVSNITPVSGTWVTLNNGLEVRFVSTGALPELVLGDYWYARALRPYGIVKSLDGSRNSEYRSGNLPTSSTLRAGWDLVTAQSPALVVLDDHNIPFNATTTLFAHGTTLFTETGGFSQVIPWVANRMAALVTSAPFRYWWVRVVMGGTALTYLRLSGLFLGPGVTFLKPPVQGGSADEQFLGSLDVPNLSTRGPHPRVFTATMPQYTWEAVRRTASGDGGRLDAALVYARDHASYTLPPFWFLLYDDDLTSLEYHSWAGDMQRRHSFLDLWDYTTSWAQVIRTVAS